MEYTFSERAIKDLRKLSYDIGQRIIEKLDRTGEENLFLINSKPLVGSVGKIFRLRVGDYRVVFEIHDNKVLVTRVGHRREIYD